MNWGTGSSYQDDRRTMARALVIEDRAPMRNIVARMLQAVGCDALEAADGRIALELWREQRATLVLLDARLPGMPTAELILQLRALDPRLPVIVMWGGLPGDLNPLREARLLSAVRILRTPFTGDELLAGVASALRSGRPDRHDASA